MPGPGSPKTRSANLGFEIRGLFCPCRRLSPKKTHSAKLAKPVYQTNPIPTASDNAIGRASGRPPTPGLPPTPNPSLDPKIELPNRPNSQNPIQIHILRTPTPDRIANLPRAAAIEKHRRAGLEETRDFSWPAERLIPQSPAPAKLRRSDTSNSLGREPQDHRPKTVSPGRGGTPPFTTNTAHRAAESTTGIPRWNPRYRNPKSPDPPVTTIHRRQINNIRQKHPKTLDTSC